jgi:hypothetical protein
MPLSAFDSIIIYSICNTYNELEESLGLDGLPPPLYLDGRLLEFVLLCPCPHPLEHIVLVVAVDVLHEEPLVPLRRLHYQLVHRPVSLLADQDLLTLHLLSLSPEGLDFLHVLMGRVGETRVQQHFLVLLESR